MNIRHQDLTALPYLELQPKQKKVMDLSKLLKNSEDADTDNVTSELYEHLNSANFKLAYDNIVQLLESPDKSGTFKNLFSFVFSNYSEELIQNSEFDLLFKCFETALKHFPADSDVLNDLGVILQR